jgi:DNA polymerase-3 subunit epsilon
MVNYFIYKANVGRWMGEVGVQNQDALLVVDVETNGYPVRNGGRVIEVGAVRIQQGCISAEMETLIESSASISFGAYQVHGISRQMLAGKPTPGEVWPLFHAFAGTTPLVAHNAQFDSSFIRHELALLGLSFANPWHCTVRLARRKLPHLPNHKLDTVYRYLFGEIPEGTQRHRALDDARMAARIWVELGEGP